MISYSEFVILDEQKLNTVAQSFCFKMKTISLIDKLSIRRKYFNHCFIYDNIIRTNTKVWYYHIYSIIAMLDYRLSLDPRWRNVFSEKSHQTLPLCCITQTEIEAESFIVCGCFCDVLRRTFCCCEIIKFTGSTDGVFNALAVWPLYIFTRYFADAVFNS